DGTPFFGGTYFPKTARYGMPGFVELLERIAAIWREKQPEIAQQGEQLRGVFGRVLPRAAARRPALERAPVAALLENLRASFDVRLGGFGGAPKFPHPTDLELCLRAYARAGDHQALDMASTTLLRMCEGGIYDQLGGGFCRYSVDAQWMIPHFEKMLYDNGPLLGLLADVWLVKGERRFAQCAEETAAWMMREMQSPEGGYYSSLDADSEHEEGKYYVWTPEEVRALLTAEEFAVVEMHYGLDTPPNFEERAWHLYVAKPLSAADEALLAAARAKLLAARALRVRPGRDEKVLVSWNALAMRGMAHAGRVFGRDEWIASARRALDFVRTRMWQDGHLVASYKDGKAHLNAYLDDYAFLLAALIELLQARFSTTDLEFAEHLAEVLLEQFEDREVGGFFFTSRDHETLIHRPKPGHDNATPSGNALAAWALGRLAALTGEDRYARAAERTVELYYPTMREYPGGFAAMAIALEEAIAPPAQLVLRGEPAELARWAAELARELLPDTTVIALPNGGTRGLPPVLDKPERPEPVNGWMCRGVTCLEPVADLTELKAACKQPAFG
ncbi:MAG TPA: DUF255 domain-containing protein, partial [Burkholderiales bacterium]|nr:DUF255 domain-containing protein [Burkholderiales bacterium]